MALALTPVLYVLIAVKLLILHTDTVARLCKKSVAHTEGFPLTK